MQQITQWAIKIVAATILITIAEMLLPENSVKKYAKLAIGFLLILVIVSPLTGIISSENDFINQIEKSMDQIEKDTQIKESTQKIGTDDKIIAEYKRKLKEYITEITKNSGLEIKGIELQINENKEDSFFGQPIRIEINLSSTGNDNTQKINEIKTRLKKELSLKDEQINIKEVQ